MSNGLDALKLKIWIKGEMLLIEQKMIELCEVNIPIIIEDGIEYYPISYLSEKVLLRKGNNIISKTQLQEYKIGIRKFEIKFGENNIQLSNCISKEYLKTRLDQTQSSRLSENQKKNQNMLHTYLGIKLISEKNAFIDRLPEDEYKTYDSHTSFAIRGFVELNNETKYQLCSSCDKYYPLDRKFFHPDERTSTGYFKICLVCEGKISFFKSDNKDLNKMKKLGQEYYEAFTKKNVIKIYEALLDGKIKFMPACFSNKESYLVITKWLLNEKKITVEELTVSTLHKIHRLNHIADHYTTNQIHFDLFGEDSYYYPWKYPMIKRGKTHTFELAKIEFNNYLKENSIKIDDKFIFKYGDVVNKAKIRLKDVLGFVVYYNEHSHAGYKYRVSGNNYYKIDENVIFDLKYMIEKDLKITVEKIPLYITKNSLRINANPIYTHIITNQNGSIFEWMNKIYPDKFTPYDFDINYYRDTFDSIEESQIHEILIGAIDNVIYNVRNTKRTITIKNMQPDWIVIGKDKCWFIEYFGMYVVSGGYNSRTNEYVEKTERKINTYENELCHYGKIYLYPEDLKNNFDGVREKIKAIQ